VVNEFCYWRSSIKQRAMNPTYLATVLSLVAVTFSFSQIATPQAPEATKPALDSVAESDSTLRTALSSYEKSAQQIREKFGKDLADLNKTRLKALEQAFDRASKKRDTETVAKLATLINSMKGGLLPEPVITKDAIGLVGTALQWDAITLFLAPDGICWGLNKEAGWTIYKSSWKPTGTNSLKWDSGGADHAIAITDDTFSGRRNDGLKFNGRVFRP
jgi:hypothetical protein